MILPDANKIDMAPIFGGKSKSVNSDGASVAKFGGGSESANSRSTEKTK